MKRIIVIGTTGSGKSALARRLAQEAGCPYVDLDDIHWLPGWQERPEEEFKQRVAEIAQQESWVVAGVYSRKAQPILWPRADTVIWLDMPFWPNFWMLLKRTLRRAVTQEPICNGNYESLKKQFLSRDSLYLWFFKTWPRNRKRYGEIFARPGEHPHLAFIRLKSYKESAAFTNRG